MHKDDRTNPCQTGPQIQIRIILKAGSGSGLERKLDPDQHSRQNSEALEAQIELRRVV
jgi:hypothetical protein